MNEMNNDFDGPVPEVGDELVVPVVTHVGRSSIFPDQIVVLKQSQTHLELVLLRQEVVIKTQRGVVLSKDGDEVAIEFSPHQVRPELLDVGHVRVANPAAADMAIGVLATLILTGEAEYADIAKRLQSMIVKDI
ncbi:hypothetical protein [Brevundimonas sp.]|uniref:hypothetical protein n=1 Tax=Brevundimonas sp. TaxID=1871086 RepID=UPI00391CCC0E